MVQFLVDREDELGFLEKRYSENTSQLIIIYGRRRIGKTELIKRFMADKKGAYILCTKDSIEENIKELKSKFFELTGKEYFLKLEADSFFDLFKYLIDEINGEKITVVFDEFSYLIELQKGVVSVFQKIWDEILKNEKVFLILCGSSIGMMETEIINYKSPLYGRRTGDLKVDFLKFRYLRDFFRKFSFEELVKTWCVFGGSPFYLSLLSPAVNLEMNLKEKVLKKGEVLYREPLILLKEEFREPKVYTLILKYLSLGYNTLGKLSSATGIDKGNLSKYLYNLEETHIIRHVLPLGRRKRGIYEMNDNFFGFWFKFVYPNMSYLEMGLVDEVFSKVKKELNSYFGHMFEGLILELVKQRFFSFPFTDAGRWWHKDREIDIVALNEPKKEILFGECKWRERVDAEKIVRELAEKSEFVDWFRGERKESFAVFAKSFSKRIKEFEGRPVYCFDLGDMEKLAGR
jgi:hypothetical protein